MTEINPLKKDAGVYLHSYSIGNGEPILCISGFGCSSYNFEWMCPWMARQGTVVLMDNRGMGRSAPAVADYELEDLADDAAVLMKQLGHSRFHVVGISMGGMIAQLLTLKYADSVLSLSLLCTSSGGDRFLPLPPLTIDGLTKFYAIPEPLRTDLAMQGLVHPSLKERSPSIYKQLVELRRSSYADFGQLIRQKKAVDRFLETATPIETITCPVLILSGDADRFVPLGNQHRLQALIPHSQLRFITESDHYFFLEKAEPTAVQINNFIATVAATAKSSLSGATL